MSPPMQPILIRCPTTEAVVQHLRHEAADELRESEFEPFECPSCRRFHLINKTGKLLGDEGN